MTDFIMDLSGVFLTILFVQCSHTVFSVLLKDHKAGFWIANLKI